MTRRTTHPYRSLLTILLTTVLILVNLLTTTPARAGSLVVDSLKDTKAVDKACTLREAIENAGANKATNADCAAGSGEDTITFSVKGTLTLTKPLTVFGRTGLTIDGGGTFTISGNEKVSLFVVDRPTPLTLKNITLQDGKKDQGGAIAVNGGNLTVINATIANNAATSGSGGGIVVSDGKLTVDGSTFKGNTARNQGGAIAAGASASIEVVITNSTFAGNQAKYYGAVFTVGKLTIDNSLFLENSATDYVGAVSGGSQPVLITNSTFAKNSSPGGAAALYNLGPTTIVNTTFVDNTTNPGASVIDVSQGRTIFRNTIHKAAPGGTLNCYNNAIVNTNGKDFNLASDDSCGKDFTKVDDLKLGELADNGGPTQTIGLLAGSPALGKGDPKFCPKTDQRGEKRPDGAACSLGAFEGIAGATTSAASNATAEAQAEPTAAATP
jgi:CSLREA domain-containing protein